VIVPERLGGSLSDEDFSALADYLDNGIPKLQNPRVDPDLAKQGEVLFQRECSRCHTSQSPSPSVSAAPVVHDIGSATSSAHVILGPLLTMNFPKPAQTVFDTVRGDRDLGGKDAVQQVLAFRPRPERQRGQFKAPALSNVFDYSVFFHDARATSLDQAIRDMSDHIGLTLDDGDRAALAAYLKTL
jgi:mono/diheme cytochrome c family protein